jgi:cellulose synthase/poly-beta-1,6-N-acetylglucosamine synthase-like glycosyltransferase
MATFDRTCNAGTNVMIRARAAFGVSRYAAQGFQSEQGHCQIYSEGEISEDIELGVRIHAAGYKSIMVCEKMATGEVCISKYFSKRVPDA